jgi:uncharacterized DUF497 family protein
MRFEWDEEKNRQNWSKHGVSFETATLVFDDPYALTKVDAVHDEEERFITLGVIGQGAVLLVVHTSQENSGSEEEVIRLISARAATSRERKTYEETHKGRETRDRRHRKEERRRH